MHIVIILSLIKRLKYVYFTLFLRTAPSRRGMEKSAKIEYAVGLRPAPIVFIVRKVIFSKI
jgi:hypothetical protein